MAVVVATGAASVAVARNTEGRIAEVAAAPAALAVIHRRWMIGSASPAMKKRISVPAQWVIKNKIKMIKVKGKLERLDPVVC